MLTKDEKKRNKNINIGMLVGISLLAIISLIIVVSILQPSPQKTVREYYKYISAENYKGAYSLLSGNYLKSKGTLEEFTALFSNARQHGTVYERVAINQVRKTSRKSQKVVAFTLYSREKGKNTQASGQYILSFDKEQNKWLIAESID
jgi:hypothetical protein